MRLQGIIHKDLKLANICFDEDTMLVTLIDLGCATDFHFPAAIGTDGYMPPECYRTVQLPDGTWEWAILEPGLKWLSQWYTSTYDMWSASWTLLEFWCKGLPQAYVGGDYLAKAEYSAADLEAFLQAQVPDELLRDFFRVSPRHMHTVCSACKHTVKTTGSYRHVWPLVLGLGVIAAVMRVVHLVDAWQSSVSLK
jgi:serine/threonine protein kinase